MGCQLKIEDFINNMNKARVDVDKMAEQGKMYKLNYSEYEVDSMYDITNPLLSIEQKLLKFNEYIGKMTSPSMVKTYFNNMSKEEIDLRGSVFAQMQEIGLISSDAVFNTDTEIDTTKNLLSEAYLTNYKNTHLKGILSLSTTNNRIYNSNDSNTNKQNKHIAMSEVFSTIKSEDDILVKNNANASAREAVIDDATGMANLPTSKLAGNIGRKIMMASGHAYRGDNSAAFYHTIGINILKELEVDGLIQIQEGKYLGNRFIQEDGSLVTGANNVLDGEVVQLNSTINGAKDFVSSLLSGENSSTKSKELTEIMDFGKFTTRLTQPVAVRESALSAEESISTTEYDINISSTSKDNAELYQSTSMEVDTVFSGVLKLLRDKFNNSSKEGLSFEKTVESMANDATLSAMLGIENSLNTVSGLEESAQGKSRSKTSGLVSYLLSPTFGGKTFSKWKWTINARLHDVGASMNGQTDKFFARAVQHTGAYTVKKDSEGYKHLLLSLEDEIGVDPLVLLEDKQVIKHLEAFNRYMVNGTPEESFQFMKVIIDNDRFSETLPSNISHMKTMWNDKSIWSYITTLKGLNDLHLSNDTDSVRTSYMTSPDGVTSGITIALMQSVGKYGENIMDAFKSLGIKDGKKGVINDFYQLLTDKVASVTLSKDSTNELVSEQDSEDYKEISLMVNSGVFNLRDMSKTATMPVAYSQSKGSSILSISKDLTNNLLGLDLNYLYGNDKNKIMNKDKLEYLFSTISKAVDSIGLNSTVSPKHLELRAKYIDILNNAKAPKDKQNAMHSILKTGDSFFNKRHLIPAINTHYSDNVSAVLYDFIDDVLIKPLLSEYKAEISEIFDAISTISPKGIVSIIPPQVALHLDTIDILSDEEYAADIESTYNLEVQAYGFSKDNGENMDNISVPQRLPFIPYNERLLAKYGIDLTKRKEVLSEHNTGKDTTEMIMTSDKKSNKPSVYVNIQHMLDNYILLDTASRTNKAISGKFKSYPVHDANIGDANTNAEFTKHYSASMIDTNTKYDALEQLVFTLGTAIDNLASTGKPVPTEVEALYTLKVAEIKSKKKRKALALSKIKYEDNRQLFGFKPIETVPSTKPTKKVESTKETNTNTITESDRLQAISNGDKPKIPTSLTVEEAPSSSVNLVKSIVEAFDVKDTKIDLDLEVAYDFVFNSNDRNSDVYAGLYTKETNTITLPDFQGLLKASKTNKEIQEAIANSKFTQGEFETYLSSLDNSSEMLQIKLHEYVHSATALWVEDNSNKPSKEYTELVEIHKYLKDKLPKEFTDSKTADGYWSTNIDEFLAEVISNPTLRKEIKKIDKIDGRTIVGKIVNAFKAVFGGKSKGGKLLLEYVDTLINETIAPANKKITLNTGKDKSFPLKTKKKTTAKVNERDVLLDDSYVQYKPTDREEIAGILKVFNDNVFNANEFMRKQLRLAVYNTHSSSDRLTIQSELKRLNKLLQKNSKYYNKIAERITTLYVDYPFISTLIHTVGFDNFSQQYEKDKLHSILYKAKKSAEQTITEVSNDLKEYTKDFSEPEMKIFEEYLNAAPFKRFVGEKGTVKENLVTSIEEYLDIGKVDEQLRNTSMSANKASFAKVYENAERRTKHFLKDHKDLTDIVDMYTTTRTMLNSKVHTEAILDSDLLLHMNKSEFKNPKEFKVITSYDMDTQDYKQQGFEVLRHPTSATLGIIYKDYTSSGQQGLLETHNSKDGIAIPSYIKDKTLLKGSNVIGDRVILQNFEKEVIGTSSPIDSFARSVSNAMFQDDVEGIRSFMTSRGIKTLINKNSDVLSLEKKITTGGSHPWVLEVGSNLQFNDLPPKIQSSYKRLSQAQAKELGVSSKGYVRSDIAHWTVGEDGINPFKNSPKLAQDMYGLVKKAVQWKKIRVVTQNPPKLLGDLFSNYELLMTNGVGMKEILIGSVSAYRAIGELQDLAREDIRNRLKGKESSLVKDHEYGFMYEETFIHSTSNTTIADSRETATGLQAAIDRGIDNLTFNNKDDKNLFGKLLDKSTALAIAPELLLHALGAGAGKVSGTQLTKGLKKLESDFSRIRSEQDGKAWLHELLGSPDSALTKAGTAAMIVSDAVPRALLYKHYRDNGKGGNKTHNQAVKEVNQMFIDYRVPLPKEIQFLADTGIIMFPAFLLRVQKSIYNLTVKKPLSILTLAIAEEITGINMVNIQENNIINRDLENQVLNPDIFGAFRLDALYPNRVL